MWLINLSISLCNILKKNALECVSVINQKCMQRPKILDVNESIGEDLFYPYNVQINKCSGSCNTLDNPMAKLCVPNIIRGVNMQVCECQCDKWCKPGQYLDHKNCVCKNQLIGRLIEECTSVINETMINNKDSGSNNNNTLRNIFIGLFSVAVLIGIICFCVFAYFKRFKSKKLFKNKYADY